MMNANANNGVNEEQQNGEDNSVAVGAQYVKDLSFENPKAPYVFSVTEQPRVDVDIDVSSIPVSDDAKDFEVVLHIHVKAMIDEVVMFIVDLEYAGLFSILGVKEEEEMRMMLLVYCPQLLFPYARRIVSDATRDGGFPPFLIAPVDFASLYLQQLNKVNNNLDDE